MSTTTTTSSTTTTTTRKLCVDCIEGLTIEVIFPENQQDVNKLGSGYTLPSCFSFPNSSSNLSNNSLLGIFVNNTFSFLGKLNNALGSGGQLYYGAPTCEDFQNIHPSWSAGTLSRYSKYTISKSLAQTIVQNTSSPKEFITIKRELASSTFSPPQICNVGKVPSVITLPAWIRVTSKSGEVLYNGCFNGATTQFDLYICGLCLNIEHRIKINPAQYEIRNSSGFMMGIFNGKPYFKITDDKNQYKVIGYIVWRNSRWEFHEKFSIITNSVSGKFYGYNSLSTLSLNSPIEAGIWVINSQTSAIDDKRILGGTFGCVCNFPEDDNKCNCEGGIYRKGFDFTGMQKFYDTYLPKLKKIQEDKC